MNFLSTILDIGLATPSSDSKNFIRAVASLLSMLLGLQPKNACALMTRTNLPPVSSIEGSVKPVSIATIHRFLG
mgnify:CR=1 FL=1